MYVTKSNSESLKNYIHFLYHNKLGELINFFHLQNLDKLPNYSQLGIKDIALLMNKEIYFYFHSIMKGFILEQIDLWVSDVRENYHFLLYHNRGTYQDILGILINRKATLNLFLQDYTKDIGIATSIMLEIDFLSSLQEKIFFTEFDKQQNKFKDKLYQTQRILTHTPTHINVYDIEKDAVLYNNGAGEKIFGHSVRKIMSEKFSSLWLNLVYPKDKKKVKERIKKFKELKDNEIDHLEYRLINKDGKIEWYYSKATIFKKKNGQVRQVLLNGLNITELKKAEKERKYIESQLKEAQKIAHIGSYDFDMVTDTIQYTDEAYRIYDLPRDKKTFKVSDFSSRLKKEDVSKFEEKLKEVLSNKDNYTYEAQYRIILPDKTEKDIMSRAKIIRNNNGKAIRMQGTVMDITSIKKAEYKLRKKNLEIKKINQKLQESQKEINKINFELEERIKLRNKELSESEARYKFIVENLPHLFWTATADGSMDFQNHNAEQYSGVQTDKLDSLNWSDVLHPHDLPKVLNEWALAFEEGKTFEMEFRMKRYDGIYRWHLVKTVPLKNKEGRIIKWMSSAIDIDEQIRYAGELKHKNVQLIKTNKDLDNFIYTASHDLKAPISNIEGLLTSLHSDLNEEIKAQGDVDTILQMMDNSVKKFKNTILDLTEITKAQKSGEDSLEENNIEEILNGVLSMIEDLIRTSNVTIKTDFKDCSYIPFSRKNLKSILYNLVSNAIKFRSHNKKPLIIIKTQCNGNYIELSVKDNGQGFDATQKSKIFEMFRRLRSDTEGSGVGLYLVKRIITNAGGKIDAESKPGKGATFKVNFPTKQKIEMREDLLE